MPSYKKNIYGTPSYKEKQSYNTSDRYLSRRQLIRGSKQTNTTGKTKASRVIREQIKNKDQY